MSEIPGASGFENFGMGIYVDGIEICDARIGKDGLNHMKSLSRKENAEIMTNMLEEKTIKRRKTALLTMNRTKFKTGRISDQNR